MTHSSSKRVYASSILAWGSILSCLLKVIVDLLIIKIESTISTFFFYLGAGGYPVFYFLFRSIATMEAKGSKEDRG